MHKPLKKILVIKLRAMGDTIVMTTTLSELKRVLPEAEIHVLLDPKWECLLEHHPAVTERRSFEKHRPGSSIVSRIVGFFKTRKKERVLISELQNENFDAVINLHASPTSARIAKNCGAPIRSIHFHGRNEKNHYSTVEISGKNEAKSIIERDLDAVRALGYHVERVDPRIFLAPHERRNAHEIMEHCGIKKPFLALGLGASRETKIWPMERFAAVADEWVRSTRGTVLTFCTKAERHLSSIFINNLSPQTKPHHQLFDTLTPRELGCFLSECVVFVGNDSGPKHLAAAVGIPTITVFGPEDPHEWHPYRSDLHPYLFVKDLVCRNDADPGFPPWCGLEVCRVENHRCMVDIPPEQVIQKIQSITN